MSADERKSDNHEQKLAIYNELDKAVKEGPWENSTILRAIGKVLRQFHFRFKEDLGISNHNKPVIEDHIANRIAMRQGQIEVFISLYSSDGDNIKKWAKQLLSISRAIVTRPIYRSERDIRALIRSKTNKKNEAYVAVYIDATEIITPQADRMPTDKLGHELMILRDKAIKAENITRFIHLSGEYLYKDEQLVRQGDIEYTDFI